MKWVTDPLSHIGRYLKSSIQKNIVQVMNHVIFQLYMEHPDRVIWNKLTLDDKYINKLACLLIDQTMFVSGVEKKIIMTL